MAVLVFLFSIVVFTCCSNMAERCYAVAVSDTTMLTRKQMFVTRQIKLEG